MSTLSQFSGGGIKSIQRGSSTGTSNRTVTITAVDVNKSIVISNCSSGYDGEPTTVIDGCYLSNSTTIQIVAGTRSPLPGGVPATVHWQVIEYY